MNTPAPDSSSNPSASPDSGAPQSNASLVQLFVESFFILGRYFIIIYPVFGFFILSSLFTPRATPNFNNWAWVVLAFGWAAIFFLFQSGWNLLMFKAIAEWQRMREMAAQDKGLAPEGEFQQIPFGLLKSFFPGVGQYGLAFLGGGFLWLALMSIPAAAFIAWGYANLGSPAFLWELQQHADTNQALVEAFERLTPRQRELVAQWDLLLLAMMGAMALLNMLVMYWQPYLIFKQCNPLQAFWYSIRHAVRHPLKTFIISFYFSFFMVSFSVIGSLNSLSALFGNFLVILTMVFFGLFLYLYLFRVDVPATVDA